VGLSGLKRRAGTIFERQVAAKSAVKGFCAALDSRRGFHTGKKLASGFAAGHVDCLS
jgi:hypothetical protein